MLQPILYLVLIFIVLGPAAVQGDTQYTVDDSDASVLYSGTWSTQTNAVEHDGGMHLTQVSGATAQFKFTGTQVKVYGALGPSTGAAYQVSAAIAVDGAAPTQYTNKGPPAQIEYNLLIYTSPMLAYGEHTLLITNHGSWFWLDDFVVTLPDTIPSGAPPPPVAPSSRAPASVATPSSAVQNGPQTSQADDGSSAPAAAAPSASPSPSEQALLTDQDSSTTATDATTSSGVQIISPSVAAGSSTEPATEAPSASTGSSTSSASAASPTGAQTDAVHAAQHGLGRVALAGIIAGVVLLFLVVSTAFLYARRRRRHRDLHHTVAHYNGSFMDIPTFEDSATSPSWSTHKLEPLRPHYASGMTYASQSALPLTAGAYLPDTASRSSLASSYSQATMRAPDTSYVDRAPGVPVPPLPAALEDRGDKMPGAYNARPETPRREVDGGVRLQGVGLEGDEESELEYIDPVGTLPPAYGDFLAQRRGP